MLEALPVLFSPARIAPPCYAVFSLYWPVYRVLTLYPIPTIPRRLKRLKSLKNGLPARLLVFPVKDKSGYAALCPFFLKTCPEREGPAPPVVPLISSKKRLAGGIRQPLVGTWLADAPLVRVCMRSVKRGENGRESNCGLARARMHARSFYGLTYLTICALLPVKERL